MGTYYLFEEDDANKSYNLGENVTAYNLNQDNLIIYGTTYQVFKDATVEKNEKITEITNLKENKFYKLDDRKYVMVGNKIQNESGTLATQKYLIIIIDKAGNTFLLNNELNAKTINKLNIKTEEYEFDVANEQLIFGENKIDLKKIIGSTNEYKQKENTTEENITNEIQENTTEVQNTVQQEQVQQELQQNNQNINNQNSQIINNSNIRLPNSQNSQTSNNQNGYTQINPVDKNSQTSAGSVTEKTEDSNKQPLLKNVSLRSINTTCTYMDINYSVIDPENRFQTVYINVKGNTEQTIALDKNQTSYRVLKLTPNTAYTVTLSYKEILQDGTIQDVVEDTMEIRTEKADNQIQITKVAGKKMYFNFKMDKTYIADSAKIAMYIDDEKVEEKEVDITKATTNAGWTSYFEYKYGTKIILKLENFMYNGKEVDITTEAKFINY